MTAKRKKNNVEVVGSTLNNEVTAPTEQTGETIAIAVSLPYDLRFDDIPVKGGGTKSITLPGINSAQRGSRNPVLALAGNALCVMLPKEDWEALLATHGKEIVFTGRNGSIPCVYPVGDKAGFIAAESEIKEMKTGLEPITPESVGVTIQKRGEQ